MALEIEQLNLLAILIATVAGMALGAAWYSPLLFGNAWLAALGKEADELGPAAPAMTGSAVACLLTAVTLALAVQAFGADGALPGALLGLLLGTGLIATAFLSDSLFCGWGWPLYRIQSGYRVGYCVLMGAILGAWG